MRLFRRRALALGLAMPALLRAGRATAATVLKISHQFPGGTATEGDFRDSENCVRLIKLAREVGA
ncbi:twin-arginine translocation pathway signal [Bradyrhizobium oligotrophicum S58]|uniref:Twin-arginine translocation pathway signal n=1 Tax=Bradyrhizobium oligotrophicum S58 TaxID=1245469 RepID=M4ZY92_9BRAD|nr:twin-arginine translocation pathway signal [Bradyrhizobium oligotrophicum S58]